MGFDWSSHVGHLRKCRKRKQSVDLSGDAPGRKGTPTFEEKRGFELLKQQKYCVFTENDESDLRWGHVSSEKSLL